MQIDPHRVAAWTPHPRSAGRRASAVARSRQLVGLALAALAGLAHAQAEVTYTELVPILQRACVMCHAGAAAPAALRLDTLDGVLAGSARGPVVESGNPSGSELIRRLKGVSEPRMPMTGPPFLTDEEVALFERWIAAGLPSGGAAAAESLAPPVAARLEPGEVPTYAHVAPIFATRCAKCHTERGLMGPAPEGYHLTSYAATLSPADRVRVVPGNPGASELVRRIRGQAWPRMPHDGPPYLDADEIALVEQWIAGGARDAEGRPAPVPEGARVRLLGTLGPHGLLDGLELVVTARTRIDKSPRAGDYVEVRGHVDAAGNVVVERLRRR